VLAAAAEDAQLLRWLLKDHPDHALTPTVAQTSLWAALTSDAPQQVKLEIIALMLEHGAQAKPADTPAYLSSPLAFAVQHRDLEIAELLLQNWQRYEAH
jgi:hypothetical protein